MEIIAICVGKAVPLLVPARDNTNQTSREVLSGIRKNTLSTRDKPTPVAVGPLGLQGDEQADLSVHGGRDKAVYAYPIEHYSVWQTLRLQALKCDQILAPGSFGENLTISGLLESAIWVGDVLSFGTGDVRLRVTAPRSPCYKFNAVMGFSKAALMMNQSGYTGFYLAVVQPGVLHAGDRIKVIPGDRHMRIDELHRMNTSRQR